ncbi:serine O-acetyltransferase [Marinoscillum sp. MHG1-6]|uniref:serine O-acetyltransferase n=1 Tax=Marinoscillum sp. MHG1-6 TaxID=2959627 RepID=UPI002157CA38|nr:serine acetyltransferase [Marinoscillum sp. MHG1-6]
MDSSFLNRVYQAHKDCRQSPPSAQVIEFFNQLMGVLFPNYSTSPIQNIDELGDAFEVLRKKMNLLIVESGDDKTVAFFDQLPEIYELLQKDIEATFKGDPAAVSHAEVVRSYPGFYAIAAYRIAHLMLQLGIDILPRIITENAHSKTGVDIHPGARIGEYFCIDHGTGIVIGETTVIGNWVKVYQGVTLGALSVNKEDAMVKRHPTIEDNVVIYAGATILGGNTVVGHHSVVGGNVWLTRSIPAESRIYYKAEMHNEDKPDVIIVKQD